MKTYTVEFGILEADYTWWTWTVYDITEDDFGWIGEIWDSALDDYNHSAFEMVGLERFEQEFPGHDIVDITVLRIDRNDPTVEFSLN